MTETYTCGDHGALVSYLYDECAPDERRAISAHVAICRTCAEELTALDATREQLATWRPPDAQLGFRIVSDAAPAHALQREGPNVLRPPQWWRKPMPAWGQAAAAAAIFATGLTLGILRGPAGSAPPRASDSVQLPSTSVSSAGGRSGPRTPVTQADLAALEQRLRTEVAQARVRTASTPIAAATAADARILEQVRAMINDSEQRQRRELALRTTEVVRDFDAQRSDDMARIERTIGQMDGTTGVEVAQQRQMLNYLMRVSQRGQ